MTELPRIRWHTDGRVALCFEPESDQDHWRIFEERPRYCFSGSIIGSLSDGWSELFVAELPEPDGQDWVGDGSKEPYWRTSSDRLWVTPDGVDFMSRGPVSGVEQIRSDALKMLAAVAACERYGQSGRRQRE